MRGSIKFLPNVHAIRYTPIIAAHVEDLNRGSVAACKEGINDAWAFCLDETNNQFSSGPPGGRAHKLTINKHVPRRSWKRAHHPI